MSLILYWIMNPINDITTQFDPPVAFQQVEALGNGVSLDYDKSFVAIQKKLHPEVQPLKVEQPTEAVFEAAQKVAAERESWKMHVEDSEAKVLQGTATTSLLKFKDDFVVTIVVSENGGSIVHMRSKSRLGRNDFNANANRIQEFFADLKIELQSTAN